LGVYPPRGRVRVAAPLAVEDDAVRLAIVGKLGWIKRKRARFNAQPRQIFAIKDRRYNRIIKSERLIGIKKLR
jgi:predicted metal-dependent hydrolase